MSSATSRKDQPQVTDSMLISRIRSGDEDALAALHDRYSQVVYSVALRVLGETTQAEDILQEIFLQLWRNPQTFDSSRGSLGAWLAVITRHRAIDQLRRRRPESDIEDVIVAVDTRIEQTTDRNMTIAKIRAVVDRLPAEQRKPLEMAFFEGLTHSEIATKTGEPLGTVKTRIRSALLTLRKALAACETISRSPRIWCCMPCGSCLSSRPWKCVAISTIALNAGESWAISIPIWRCLPYRA